MYSFTAYGYKINSDIYFQQYSDYDQGIECSYEVTVRRKDYKKWPSIQYSPLSTATTKINNHEFRLKLNGIGQFRSFRNICVEWNKSNSEVHNDDITTFLSTSCLPVIAMQSGDLVLAGTSLVKNGKTIVLLGMPVTGKSTLAFVMCQNGWSLLSSEITCVRNFTDIFPGIHQLRLWQKSVTQLGMDQRAMMKVRPSIERYIVAPSMTPKVYQPCKLDSIFVLTRQNEGQQEDLEEHIRRYSENPEMYKSKPNLAMYAIRENVLYPRVYRGMGLEIELFKAIANVATNIPVYPLSVPEGIENLSAWVKKLDSFTNLFQK